MSNAGAYNTSPTDTVPIDSGIGAELNAAFRQQTGRDLRPDEASALAYDVLSDNSGNAYRKNPTGRVNQSVNNYVGGLNSMTNQITNTANALGIKNFTAQNATDILNQIYKPGTQNADTLNNFSTYANSALQNFKLNQLTNPAVSDQNSQDAARIVQQIYGRAATPDETAFFAKQIAKGETPYELGQFLQTTPEYMKTQADQQQQKYTQEAQAAQDALNSNLMDQQHVAFQRAMPEILSQYMKSGTLNSSGLDSAVANAQAELDRNRQAFMGNIGYQTAVQGLGYNRQDFLNQQGQAFQQYLRQSQPQYQQNMDLSQMQVGLPFQQANNLLNRQYQLQDYNMQRNDYSNYLNQARRNGSQNALYGLAGSALGSFLGPMGMAAGGAFGNYLGNNVNYADDYGIY